MSRIYEVVRNETINVLQSDAENDSPLLKSVTVRIPDSYVKLADKIASLNHGTRQGLLGLILIEGIDEALKGYASVFKNPQEVADELCSECGVGVFSSFSQEGTFEEAEEAQRQLEEDFAAHEAEQAKRK